MHISGSYTGLQLQKASGAAGNGVRFIIPWRKDGLSLLRTILVHAMSWHPQQKPGEASSFVCCHLQSWLHLELIKIPKFLIFSPLWLSWGSPQEAGGCFSAAGLHMEIPSFLLSFSPSPFPAACSLSCLSAHSGQPPMTNCIHTQRLSSCIRSY